MALPVDMIYLQLLCTIVLSNVFHVPLANWAYDNIGISSQGCDSRAGKIVHSVANGSKSLRRFFEAVLPRC